MSGYKVEWSETSEDKHLLESISIAKNKVEINKIQNSAFQKLPFFLFWSSECRAGTPMCMYGNLQWMQCMWNECISRIHTKLFKKIITQI